VVIAVCEFAVVKLAMQELEDVNSCSSGIVNIRVEFAAHDWDPGSVLFGRQNEAAVYKSVV
jgi:hypothetical protein